VSRIDLLLGFTVFCSGDKVNPFYFLVVSFLSPHHHDFNRYLNRVNEQNLINSFGFQEDKGNYYLKRSLKKNHFI